MAMEARVLEDVVFDEADENSLWQSLDFQNRIQEALDHRDDKVYDYIELIREYGVGLENNS